MLIKENSVLKKLPLFEEKQLLILDSLRFTAEIVDYNYQEMEKRILKISKDTSERKYPELFHYSWSILDGIRRFIRLFKVLDTNAPIKSIEYVNSPRNTYQHLDARIDESLIESKQPFYGTLKWTYHDRESNEAIRFIAISGILYGDPGKVEFVNFNRNQTIENICLETVDKKTMTEINLSKLYLDFEEVIRNLEHVLEKQILTQNGKLLDWTSQQDILLKIKRTLPE